MLDVVNQNTHETEKESMQLQSGLMWSKSLSYFFSIYYSHRFIMSADCHDL